MGIKKYNPRTPSLRYKTGLTFDEITATAPEKSLTVGLSKNAGRGAGGRIAVRRRGGGHKRKYRVIDFRRDKIGIPGKVVTIEYDPNRTANIVITSYSIHYTKLYDENELQSYLVNEVQEVYRMQGVVINDKHIGVIVRP